MPKIETAQRRWRGASLIIMAVLAAAGGIADAAPARADQPDAANGTAADDAMAARTPRNFDLPAQPLAQALLTFGQQAQLQVTVDGAALGTLSSPAVRGRMTPAAALDRLLAGSGLAWRVTDAGTVIVEKQARSAAGDVTKLAPIPVQGASEGEPSSAPVEGYVADQSSAGTKTDTPILKTPQSVSVVTADQIAAQGAQSVTDALRYTAGVNVQPYGIDSRFDWLNIRGYDASDFLYRDGLGVPSNQLKIEPYGLERIEVLKGPASVTYGQMAPGGLVNAVTKRPTDTPLHSVELVGGSYDHIEGRFDIGGPLAGDKRFLYRLTGVGRSSGTQVDHTPDDRGYIAPAFTWRPNEDTALTLLTDYRHDSTRYPQGFPVSGTLQSNDHGKIPTSTYLGEPDQDKFEREQYNVGFLFSHRMNDTFTLHQDFRYSHYDYALVGHNPIGFVAGSDREVNRIIWVSDPEFDALTTDTRAEADFDTGPLTHKLLLGVNWMRSEQTDRQTIALSTPIDVYDPDYGNAGDVPDTTSHTTDTLQQVGVYIQEQVSIADSVFITVSGRQDWANNATRDHVAGDETADQDSDDFTWRAGISYVSPIGLAPYFSYATAFEPTAGTDFNGESFTPTTSEQYEVGLKYQPPGTKAMVTLSAFDLTQQNVLTSDPDPTHAGYSIQTGETRTRGIELEAAASLAEGLDLIGSYTFLDAKITKSNNGDEGFDVMGIPHHAAALWGDYTFQEGALRGFGFGLGARYLGSTWDNTNTLKTPDYVLFDAAVHYDLGAMSDFLEGTRLSVNARNLADKTYISSCAYNTCYYGDRLNVLATLSYRW